MARRPSSVCPSIRPSVNFCANRFFSRANGRIATKLAHDGLRVSLHPGSAQGQGQGQRSRDTGTFVQARKSLILAGKWPDHHQTCTWWSPGKRASRLCSRSRSRSKVTWYAHFLSSHFRCLVTFIYRRLKNILLTYLLSWILGMRYSVIDGIFVVFLSQLCRHLRQNKIHPSRWWPLRFLFLSYLSLMSIGQLYSNSCILLSHRRIAEVRQKLSIFW